ncbi:outer membrane lipoprotein chaperone LolA [Chromatium okenii]|jgi:outer membrane lipoprotein carrier protein|uniref:Outer-membrane lipoprotein carrier protein n=1 Tax=Chromatium okenii TaxID=61644 RepID=A0A2S7XS64_9GAMM|nr:outer membrane lipoprotein chaperone LolA [Chromatium okenii]PQJ96577.1 outer membrane lipoprotein carrier protein LolA [Chromatium okenii]
MSLQYLSFLSLIQRVAYCGILLGGMSIANAADTNRVDAYLANLNTLTAEFEQYTFNADHTQMLEAHGTLYLQRPGRFRWEYDSPTQQVIVADGKRVYLHDIDLQQVSHQNQDEALRGTPALLLANREPIATHFTINTIASTDGRDWVELTPKDQDTDVVKIQLGFGQDTLDSLIMQDSFGQETRLNFSQAQRNTTLKPELFKIEQNEMDDFLQMD